MYDQKSNSFYRSLIFIFFINIFYSLFSYPLDFSNPASLEKIWKNRQSEEGQKELLDFVKKASESSEISDSYDLNWRVARLTYYAGNFGIGHKTLTKKELLQVFKYGYESAEKAKELEPEKVEGYFWFAVNLGSYGLTKGVLTALGNAKTGRDALLKAAEIDETYWWGGPYRILGRYYQEVPKLISFGDKEIAENYFKKAIEIAPEFRLNTVYLALLLESEGLKEEALSLFKKAAKKPDIDGKNEELRYQEELKNSIQRLSE